MSYLLDKKIKRKKTLVIIFLIIIFCALVYFRAGIFYVFSTVGHALFRPVFNLGNNIGDKFSSASSNFHLKKTLFIENENLKSEIDSMNARLTNYDAILEENSKIKEILSRVDSGAEMILSVILAKPNQSPYDTLIIDVGESDGIREGERVFALGNVPVGRIAEVYRNSSKVILFSNSGEKTEVVVPLGHSQTGEAVKDVFTEVIGRGGGNFEMILDRNLLLPKGTGVVLRGITSYTLATVETTISDPRDSFQRVLLVSSVNVQELKFVQVELQK